MLICRPPCFRLGFDAQTTGIMPGGTTPQVGAGSGDERGDFAIVTAGCC